MISSVHSFTQSGLGPFFIGFLRLRARRRRSRSWSSGCRCSARENQLESFFSREAAFLFNNLILVGIAFAIFWGTVFPVISEWVRGVKITVGPPFFNRVNAPLGLALLFLMGVGPVIAWRRATPRNLGARTSRVPVGGGRRRRSRAVRARHACALRRSSTFSLGVFVARDDRAGVLARHARAPGAARRERRRRALVRLVGKNRRRYGGYIIHVGVVLIFIGIAGSCALQGRGAGDAGAGPDDLGRRLHAPLRSARARKTTRTSRRPARR